MTAISLNDSQNDSPTRDDLGRRYLRASLDSVLRGGASLVISGFVPMVLARFLGPHDFGIYAIITALTALIAGLFHMGQNSALHKLLPEYYVSDRARGGAILANVVTFTLVLIVVFCVSFVVGAPLVAETIYHDPSLTQFFRFCAVMIFVTTMLNLASSIAAGMQDYQAYNTALLIRSGLLIVLACIGVAVWGLWGALVSQLLASGIGLLWLGKQLIKVSRERFSGLIRPSFSPEIWRTIGAFMLPAFVITLLNMPCYWWATSLTAREHGFASAGLFSAAYGLAQLISLAPFNFYTPAMTFLTEANASADPALFNRLARRSLRTIWLLTLPLALGCALFSPLLIRILYGEKFTAAAPAAFVMGVAGFFMAIVGFVNAVIAARGRIWHGCGIVFGWAVIFAVTGWLAIPRWGAIGAAATFAGSYILYLLFLCLYLHFALRINLRTMGRPTVLTMGSCLLAATLIYTLTGLTFYLAAAALLASIIGIGVFWVCDETERSVCERGLIRFRQVVWSW
jgi:O-antigen/teichoic acid export membrane protein